MRNRSHQMAKFAEIAYLDAEEAKPKFRAEGFRKHVFLENDGAQCHVIWNQKEVILCFRGTEPGEFSDIKADLNAFPDRANNGSGWVHNGFQEEVNKLWADILTELSAHDDKDLLITGHSLGGAMATIATSRLGDAVKALFTFGSPRAGTRKFVKAFHISLTIALLITMTLCLRFHLQSWDTDTMYRPPTSITTEILDPLPTGNE